MKPLRMCMVCRERKEKQDLIRVVHHKEHGIQIDRDGKLPGRGAYLCRRGACIDQAQKRKALERAFSTAIDPEVYASLAALREEEADES